MHVLLMGFPPFQDPTDLEAGESIEEDLIPLHSPQYAHIPYPAKDLLPILCITVPTYILMKKLVAL